MITGWGEERVMKDDIRQTAGAIAYSVLWNAKELRNTCFEKFALAFGYIFGQNQLNKTDFLAVVQFLSYLPIVVHWSFKCPGQGL